LYSIAKQQEPRLSIATVYRNLRELEERGLVIRHTFHPGSSNWELARESHDHLVDIESGLIVEFINTDLRRALEAAARGLGYRLSATSLALYGVKESRVNTPVSSDLTYAANTI
jgi:Fur family ferric uptake transcriptional regulator